MILHKYSESFIQGGGVVPAAVAGAIAVVMVVITIGFAAVLMVVNTHISSYICKMLGIQKTYVHSYS